jgi:sulfide:quinone oxidoreductase
MAKISIIGAGFAGLTAIRLLRRKMPQADITLIAPEATFLYYPSLIWIPTGLRTAKDILLPLGPFLQRTRVHFHQARALGLKDGGRIVVTTAGEVANEALIIASGGRGLRALPGIEHSWAICDGLEAAEAIRDRLNGLAGGTLAFGFASNPKEPPAVRGGPVFELLFGIESYLHRTGRRARFDLVFFNPMREPGNRLGSKAVARLLLDSKLFSGLRMAAVIACIKVCFES